MEDKSIQNKIKNRVIKLCQKLHEDYANTIDVFNELYYLLWGWDYNGNEILKNTVKFVASATDILPSRHPNTPRCNVYLLSEDRVVKFDRKEYTQEELEHWDQREQTMLEFYKEDIDYVANNLINEIQKEETVLPETWWSDASDEEDFHDSTSKNSEEEKSRN